MGQQPRQTGLPIVLPMLLIRDENCDDKATARSLNQATGVGASSTASSVGGGHPASGFMIDEAYQGTVMDPGER